MANQVFKPCQQHQLRLLPLDLDVMVADGHLVRVVDDIISSIDTSELYSLYKGGGTSAYDPVMLLKVIVYAYASGIYSSRKIEAATRENVNFLWLCGQIPLDHATISRFRTQRLKDVFEDIFASVIELLAKRGYLTLKTYFLDGTKIEANANKYSFTWAKSTKKNQTKLREKIHAHLETIDRLNEAEDALLGDSGPQKIDTEEIKDVAAKINKRLKERKKERECDASEASKKIQPSCEERVLKRTAKAIEKDWLPRMERYESDLEAMGSRKSLSKTDRDATFMRMKEDAMKNGQLKAAYNVQAGTEDQFILGYTIHQRPGDTACMTRHLDHFKDTYGHLPDKVVADAGYGSEENYDYLDKNKVEAFVKYNWFFKEQKRKHKEDPFDTGKWPYDERTDTYTCPEGRTLVFDCIKESTSDTGYVSCARVYRCSGCDECPSKKRCVKETDNEHNRSLAIRPRLKEFRDKARLRLISKEGVKLRKQRNTDVETVFGDIKYNHQFKRFTLRGLAKVTLEFGLVAMGHNMRKASKMATAC